MAGSFGADHRVERAGSGPGSRKLAKSGAPLPPLPLVPPSKHTTGMPGGQSDRRGGIAEHELGAGVAEDEIDGCAAGTGN